MTRIKKFKCKEKKYSPNCVNKEYDQKILCILVYSEYQYPFVIDNKFLSANMSIVINQ